MTTKRPRKRGVLPKMIAELMARQPNISAPEVARALDMSVQHARNVMRKVRGAPLTAGRAKALAIAPGSALSRLVGGGPGLAKSQDERRFVAAALMLGLSRADELLRDERERLRREIDAA